MINNLLGRSMTKVYKLFIDDLREVCGPDWLIARTSEQAINIIKKNGMPDIISFDHDLSGDDKSTIVTQAIHEMVLDGDIEIKPDFRFWVHSDNPNGKDNIIIDMKNIYKYSTGLNYPIPDYKLWIKNGNQELNN
jgi:hypothetical protein